MTNFELARQVLREHCDDWQAARLHLADLQQAGLGSYASAYRLLALRLLPCEAARPVQLLPAPIALERSARAAGYDRVGVLAGSLLLSSRGVFASVVTAEDLPQDDAGAATLVRWLGWQFDEIATNEWAAKEAERAGLQALRSASPLLLTVACEQGSNTWEVLPVIDEALLRRYEDLLLSDECSLAFVDGKLCVVVDQDFLCADSGDGSRESEKEVVERLRTRLVPTLERIVGSCPGDLPPFSVPLVWNISAGLMNFTLGSFWAGLRRQLAADAGKRSVPVGCDRILGAA